MKAVARFTRALSLVLLGGVASAQFASSARATPIVFDFEDGLQGWTLHGSAQRVNTQVLGGQWAVFGDGLADGGASIFNVLNLTDIDSIIVDAFFPGTPSPLVPTLIAFLDHAIDGKLVFYVEPTRDGEGNAGRLTYDLPPLFGAGVTLAWAVDVGKCRRAPCPPREPDSRLAFIDNITLVPIPEPATLLLVLGGLATLLRARRRGALIALAFAALVGTPTARAATVTALPEVGSFRPGDVVDVSLTLRLDEGEAASLVIGRLGFVGLRTVAEVRPRDPVPPVLPPFPSFQGLPPDLLAARVDFLRPGTFEIRLEEATGQFDLPGPPFVGILPIKNVGETLALFTVVPEPATGALVALGLAGVDAWSKRRRRWRRGAASRVSSRFPRDFLPAI